MGWGGDDHPLHSHPDLQEKVVRHALTSFLGQLALRAQGLENLEQQRLGGPFFPLLLALDDLCRWGEGIGDRGSLLRHPNASSLSSILSQIYQNHTYTPLFLLSFLPPFLPPSLPFTSHLQAFIHRCLEPLQLEAL